MGRNEHGVRAASESSIEISFQYNGRQCRERVKIKPTPANLDRARRHREDILDAIAAGTFDYAVTFPNSAHLKKHPEARPLTLGLYLDGWLKAKRPQIKSSTYASYRKIIGRIINAIGDILLADIKRKPIVDYAASLGAGAKTVRNILSPLRSALDDAVHDELIDVNPIANWHYRKIEPPRKPPIDPFTKEEMWLILEQMTGQHLNLIQFAFWTGLRTSELVALEWGDIDWRKPSVNISKARTQAARDDETPKTHSGQREVKLFAPALEALARQKEHTYLANGKIFHNPRTGQPWQGDQPIRKTCWNHALKKAGIRYRKPYSTRHTFASMMLTSGENIAWLSRTLGHSSIEQTLKAYATYIPETISDAGEKAVALFANHDGQSLNKKC